MELDRAVWGRDVDTLRSVAESSRCPATRSAATAVAQWCEVGDLALSSAIEALRGYVRECGPTPFMLQVLAELLADSGDLCSAELSLTRAARLATRLQDRANVHNAQAHLAYQFGAHAAAVHWYDLAYAVAPGTLAGIVGRIGSTRSKLMLGQRVDLDLEDIRSQLTDIEGRAFKHGVSAEPELRELRIRQLCVEALHAVTRSGSDSARSLLSKASALCVVRRQRLVVSLTEGMLACFAGDALGYSRARRGVLDGLRERGRPIDQLTALDALADRRLGTTRVSMRSLDQILSPGFAFAAAIQLLRCQERGRYARVVCVQSLWAMPAQLRSDLERALQAASVASQSLQSEVDASE